MKRVLIAVAFVCAAAGQSLAADLPEPMPPPPPQAPVAYIPVTAPVYNWGGVYFGVSGGYAFGNTNWTFVDGLTTGDFRTSGYFASGTFGINVQADAFVFGVEGDFGPSNITATDDKGICVNNSCETRNTWFGTARARAGYAADRLLIYATAGGAFGNVEQDTNGTIVNTNKLGWTAGAGLETAVTDNLTARIEYLYLSFENATYSNNVTISYNANLIRAGFDYKFR